MSKFILIGVLIAALFLAFSFYNKQSNVPTIYSGITPCADCPGIERTITFNKDFTYTDQNVYQERNTSFTDQGKWQMIKGSIYELTDEKGSISYFLLQGDKIEPLDKELNPLPAPYNAVLTKQ